MPSINVLSLVVQETVSVSTVRSTTTSQTPQPTSLIGEITPLYEDSMLEITVIVPHGAVFASSGVNRMGLLRLFDVAKGTQVADPFIVGRHLGTATSAAAVSYFGGTYTFRVPSEGLATRQFQLMINTGGSGTTIECLIDDGTMTMIIREISTSY